MPRWRRCRSSEDRQVRPTDLAATSLLFASLSWTGACAPGGATPSPAGEWRAALESPGGELPFGLRIEERSPGEILAVVVNGEEVVPFETARMERDRILL